MRENIIISDLHGCIEEFNCLLDKICYDPIKHRIILVGDILDRGSDPVGLLHQIIEMEIESVIGNHELKALKWRKHEALKQLTGQDNPIKTPPEPRKSEWMSLTPSDLNWIANLPCKIHVTDNWYVVHAGAEQAYQFKDQKQDTLTSIRYVDQKTLKKVKAKNKEQPTNSYFWANAWNQPFNLIFGHQGFEKPTWFKNTNNTCIGIDTRCCFGGYLTAFNLTKTEFIQVKAKKSYWK